MARRKKDKKKINIFKILSIILILVFVYLTPTVIKKIITIKNVKCESQYGICPEELNLNIDDQPLGDLKIVKKEIENNLDNSYLVDSYLVQYQIPSTLKVDLLVKKPMYTLYSNGIYYLLDKDGVVLETVSETNLPFVNYNTSVELGKKVKDEAFFACKLVNYLNKLYSTKSGEVKNGDLYVKVDNLNVIFPISGDEKALVGALRLIYSRLNENGSEITIDDVREIDLRFDNPVIRKK